MSQDPTDTDTRPAVQALFAQIKARLPELEALLGKCSDHWGFEDPVYRYYHQSFKVYGLQSTTERIVQALTALSPERPLDARFLEIVATGTGKTFEREHNQRWAEVTRPILEAFFHARYFLEMVVRYGKTLEAPPNSLPSGWAAVLCLYRLR